MVEIQSFRVCKGVVYIREQFVSSVTMTLEVLITSATSQPLQVAIAARLTIGINFEWRQMYRIQFRLELTFWVRYRRKW